MNDCKLGDYKNWRTPNELVFVCVCQNCGKCATSMIDGGVAFSKLGDLHSTRLQDQQPKDWSKK